MGGNHYSELFFSKVSLYGWLALELQCFNGGNNLPGGDENMSLQYHVTDDERARKTAGWNIWTVKGCRATVTWKDETRRPAHKAA